MISFWQTDPRLALSEREYSCAVLDSLYLMPDDYTPDQVNALVLRSILNKLLDAECTIQSWALWLGSLASSETAVKYPLQFSRIAGADYVCDADERELIKWWIEGVRENHFTVGDGHSHVAWDSMNRPDIMALPTTKFVEKVVVKVG